MLQAEVPGFDAAAAGNPDGRVRLLQRPRPDVHIAQLGVLAVEAERFRARPRLDDQAVRLVVLVAQRGGRLAVTEIGVHRRADREPGDQPAAAHHVEHGELLGHANRRVVQGDAVAHDHQRCLRRAARQRRPHDVGRRHEAVGVLVMLVHADAVEPETVGEFQLIEVLVVQMVSPFGIEQRTRHVHPHAAVLVLEIVRQIRVRH